MPVKILITIGILLYALVVPILEINSTHVFNPAWVAHARLHEVWQLATNTTIGLFCLWLVWLKNEVRFPSLFTFFIFGGFLFSYVIRATYGGSMVHPNGSEATIVGINMAVFGAGLGIIFTVLALILHKRTSAAV
ncbi:MAG TPA: hypothetical protein PK212_08715 [Agitococcus sp.]|nr:hypothetical protein [Agitococcus sp.]HNA21338.1 hypothetical protein [Agitococcus sp.]HNE91831.1 hypothetical protein [Agitococcus sp.]HNN27904.1 hypothetical protein [Agitococcus sp.]